MPKDCRYLYLSLYSNFRTVEFKQVLDQNDSKINSCYTEITKVSNNLKTVNAERKFQKESEFLKKAAPVNSGNKGLSNYTSFLL